MTSFDVVADILLSATHPVTVDGETAGAVGSLPRQDERRDLVADRLKAGAAAAGPFSGDPVLATLAGIRRQRLELEASTRRLLAYAREFVRPRPYRLIDLADASGMSISGVRTAYDQDDITQVAEATGLEPINATRQEREGNQWA